MMTKLPTLNGYCLLSCCASTPKGRIPLWENTELKLDISYVIVWLRLERMSLSGDLEDLYDD